MGNGKLMTSQDAYYDGLVDGCHEIFDEDLQEIVCLDHSLWGLDDYGIDDYDWNEMKRFDPNLSEQ